MPQVLPVFEVVEEFEEMAQKIVKKFPDIFGGTPIKKIRCVSIVNKNRSSKKTRLWSVKPVPDPIRLDCPYYYYIIVYQGDWASLPETKQYLLLMDALQAIPVDDDDIRKGKVLSPDLSEFGIMIRTFGVDFMENSEIHPLEDYFEWKY
ncbi:MAG: putative metallopeptidase [Elusimicrobiota bacterium]